MIFLGKKKRFFEMLCVSSVFLFNIPVSGSHCFGKDCFPYSEDFRTNVNISELKERYGAEKNAFLLKHSLTPVANIRFYEDIVLMNNPNSAGTHYRLWTLYEKIISQYDTYHIDIDLEFIEELARIHFTIAYKPEDANAYDRLGIVYESISRATEDIKKKESYRKLAQKHYAAAIALGGK
jgi:hypothetical protein